MREGDAAPDFELTAHDGTAVTLGSFRGKKNVMLCFYPKNRLFACPSRKVLKMSQSIAASYGDIVSAGSVLFAVSSDTVESQKRFVEEHDIPYPHLADPEKRACRAYAGLNMARLARRSTFVIDRGGIVRRIFRDTDAERHGRQILDCVRTL